MVSKGKSLSVVSCIVLAVCVCVTAIPAQALAQCPTLPEPTIFTGETLFNNTVRSQMWITDDVWWGAFSDASSGIYFYKGVEDNFVKGDFIDDNFLAGKPDTIWNGEALFILIYQTGALARLYKYSYDSDTQTYSLLEGFPVDLPLSGGVSDIAFDQDSTGKLWATYTDSFDRGVHVIWSTSGDHTTWDTTGTILASGLADFTNEAATIARFEAPRLPHQSATPLRSRGAIGVVWDNQVVGEIGFRFHRDEDAEDDWSPQETVDCCEGIPGVADDHLSLRAAPDDRLFLIAKDGIGNGRLHLYIRNEDGEWGQKTIVDPDPNAAATRQVLVLDDENDDAYVLYRDSNKDGRIFFARTSLESPAFSQPCVFINTLANNVTSTKQLLDGTTDLIAAASDNGQIFSNIIDLGSPAEPTPEPELPPAPEDGSGNLQAHRDPQTSRSKLVQGAPAADYGFIGDGWLSHSATPNDDAQWRWLRAQGVNTIVNLDHKRSAYGTFGFENFLWIPLANGAPATNIDAERFLKFVQDPDNQPVHLLSAEGHDRIATMSALISYAIDGQTMEAALARARLHNEGNELSPTQVEWLRRWAMDHRPGSHRRK